MANAKIYRPTITRYVNAQGTRVTKSTPGARKQRVKSKTWWGRFRDAEGNTVRVSLDSDRETAETMLARKVLDVREQKAGIHKPVDPYAEHRRRPLADHLEDYRRHLEAKGKTQHHVRESFSFPHRIFTDRQCLFIGDVEFNRIVEYLHERRRETRTLKDGTVRPGISIRTCNNYVTKLKSFFNWMVRSKRVAENPLLHLQTMNAEEDRRRIRRPAADEEFSRLLIAALKGSAFRGLTGIDRATLYLLAVNTGFRASELASLTEYSFDLATDPPTVTVQAAYSKHRREDEQVLRHDVAAFIQQWLVARRQQMADERATISIGIEPQGPKLLWMGTWRERAASMLRKDLEAARQTWLEESSDETERISRNQSDFLQYAVAGNRFLDFHALRHTFGTNLDRSGVRPKVAQELMRHSDIKLTMQVYTHTTLVDHRAAIDSLPGVPSLTTAVQAAAATGTDGKPEKWLSDGCPDPSKIRQSQVVSCPPSLTSVARRTEGKKSNKTGENETDCDSMEGDEKEAAGQIRTVDLRFTKASLCRLSYGGNA